MSNIVSMLEEIIEPEAPKVPGVRPVGFRVLVWPLPTERVTKGGIVIPPTKVEREDMAQKDVEVIGIGPDCWQDKKGGPWCKVGDIVKIAAYSGYTFKGLDGREYRMISDIDIVGVCDA